MNKINKLLAIAALAFSSVVGAWEVDTAGCFAKTDMHYPDGGKGEYHVTIASQTVFITLQNPAWEFNSDVGHDLVVGVFDDGHKTMVKIGPASSDRLVASLDFTDVNKALLIRSNTIDLVKDDGQSAITFTLYGFERIIPILEQCSSPPSRTYQG